MRWNTTIELQRATGATVRVEGVTQAPVRVSSQLDVLDVQPLSPLQLQALEAGRQASDYRQIWAKSPLYPADDGNPAQPADYVVVDGVTYEVASLSDWTITRTRRAAHYHAIIRRVHPAGYPESTP